MKKLARFRFREEDIVLADHQPPTTDSRRFTPETVSWGGGGRITLSAIQENRHHGEISSNQAVLDDDVDTTLGFSTAVSRPHRDPKTPTRDHDHVFKISSNPTALDDHDSDDEVVYNPTPLRWFRPASNGVDSPVVDDEDEVDTTLSLRPPGTTTSKKSKNLVKRVREGGGDDEKKKKRRRRRSRNNEEEQRPLVPIEEIEGLMHTVESRGGSRPVFLYRKKLEDSDVRRDQNRVFMNRGERVMEFLREEEAAAVDGKGLRIVGVDGGGKVYEKLVMKKWASLKMTVINADWSKVVDANEGKKGDVMEIWGYRENEKPCFAFIFRRENDA